MKSTPEQKRAAFDAAQSFARLFPGFLEALSDWAELGSIEQQIEAAQMRLRTASAEEERIRGELDGMHRAAADKIAAERKAADEDREKAQRTHNDIIVRAKTKAEGIIAEAAEQAGQWIRQVDALKAEHLDLTGKIEFAKTAHEELSAKVKAAQKEHKRISGLIEELKAKL